MPAVSTRLSAAAMGLVLAAPGSAAALDSTFSFVNALYGDGRVTGIIRGLDEGTHAATSVEILTNSEGYGLGEYIGAPASNTWTVTDGVLTYFRFVAFRGDNSSPGVTDSSLVLDSSPVAGATFRAGLSNSPDGVRSSDILVSTEDIALTFTPIRAVPAAAGLLLVLGLGAVVALRRA